METTFPLPDASAMPLHRHLRHHARSRPEATACQWYGRAITWREVDQASDAFAARRSAMGVQKEDPVALFMNNCPQYVMAHYGIQKLGAIVCPCGPLYKEHGLEYQLNDLQTRVLVAADGLLPIVERVRARTALQHVFVVRYGDLLPDQPTMDLPAKLKPTPTLALATATALANPPPGTEDFLLPTRSDAICPKVTLSMNDVSLITYTSGTTGLPKGAMLTYGNAVFKTGVAINSNGIRADDVSLAVAPLHHIAGMIMGVNTPILSRAPCILHLRFDPVAVLQAISRYRVTWWYSIAPMNVAVMGVPGARADADAATEPSCQVRTL